jgi:hypothetical protein
MTMEQDEIKPPRIEHGLPVWAVVTGGLVVLLVFTALLYVLAREIGKYSTAFSLESLSSSSRKEEKEVPPNRERAASGSAPAAETSVVSEEASTNPAAAAQTATPNTNELHGYITYGGKAILLSQAMAVLGKDKSRLALAFFSPDQADNEKPVLAVLLDFKDPAKGCSIDNVKRLSQVFNLKDLGNIKAQHVEIVRNQPEEMGQSLSDFTCELRSGGKVAFSLLGSDSRVLKPLGSTFGWGLRLSQEIQ